MGPSKPGHPDSVVGTLYILAAITAWGAYFPFAKIILARLSPEVFLIFRLGIGTGVLALLLARRQTWPTWPKRDLGIVLLAGLIGIILHQLVQMHGLRHTSATNTGWILTLIPPTTGILGWLFLREKISMRQILGLVVAMTGVVLFVSDGHPARLSLIGNRGDLLALTSVLTWSAYTVLTKSRLSAFDPLTIAAMHMGMGFVFFSLMGGMHVSQQAAGLSVADWAIVVMIGIVPSGLAYYWWTAGLKRLSVINTSMFLFIEAVIASATAAVVLGERFTPTMAACAVVIGLGVYMAQRRSYRKDRDGQTDNLIRDTMGTDRGLRPGGAHRPADLGVRDHGDR